MPRNLVIVESPAKARTIERYLGPDFHVLASYGHVRDLPENPGKGKLGVDTEHGFRPEYVVPADRRKQVDTIAREARRADAVWLATDLDREGEAIAWHVAEAADVPLAKQRRVTFSEITEGAIRDAFAHPREIDAHLVDAQQTRRIVDRLVGYSLSPLLSRKVRNGLSAGRVQSVAVRLVVDREREIRAFVAREYWTIKLVLESGDGVRFEADLVRIDGAAAEIADEAVATGHVDALRALRPRVEKIGTRRSRRSPAPPFTTSTLQQEASRKLGFSPKRTMSVAQRLYEGVETGEGQVGLITYMRTDSTAIAGVAMAEARAVIGERFGGDYVLAKGRVYRTRVKGAQEAHESIRPTSFARTPESVEAHLKADEVRLYRLIWQRALASQMADKVLETASVELEADRYGLRASATRTVFDGFARVYTEGRDDAAEEETEGQLPPLTKGDLTDVRDVTPTQHFTEPPPRFSEATLIKALEEHGIGRPSTYAAIISTILDRGYVRLEERRLRPEAVGEIVTDLLVEHFGDLVDLAFTARMEERLDEVARGTLRPTPLLEDFYTPFRERVDEKRRVLRRRDITTEPSDEVCSLGHPMVIRLGPTGRFLACSTYPEHKETRPLPGEEGPAVAGEGEACPRCGEGVLTVKRGRFGPFLGCSRYPDCDYIRKEGPPPPPPLPFTVACPRCGEGHLVPRRARRSGSLFYGCSRYPSCDYTTNFEPLGATHDADAGPVGRRGESARCLRCGALIEAPEGEDVVGRSLPGGPPDPAALARPTRSRAAGAGAKGRSAKGARTTRT
ncbi:MAG TPA: type I DNA topoisomerase, partial [Candidatus Limnocylindrales bacterium]|nr:type I DNA topoisomerase [Candidatus Limnocylindrales bacterium]